MYLRCENLKKIRLFHHSETTHESAKHPTFFHRHFIGLFGVWTYRREYGYEKANVITGGIK